MSVEYSTGQILVTVKDKRKKPVFKSTHCVDPYMQKSRKCKIIYRARK